MRRLRDCILQKTWGHNQVPKFCYIGGGAARRSAPANSRAK
ncbi:unnamed protein product [Ixodes persulcatus]